MAGDGDRLLADALHEIAVGGEHVGVMIDDRREMRGQHPLGERHADRGRDPLPERTGRRFDADRVAVFGMARRLRADLAEGLQIVDRQPLCRRRRRSDREARRAASSRGRPRARSGRGRASAGSAASNFRTSRKSTVATSAAPIGRPGWPLLAFSTASTARNRIALAMESWLGARRHGGSPLLGSRFRLRRAQRPPVTDGFGCLSMCTAFGSVPALTPCSSVA